jgi:hypothetical protein
MFGVNQLGRPIALAIEGISQPDEIWGTDGNTEFTPLACLSVDNDPTSSHNAIRHSPYLTDVHYMQ